MQNNPSPAQVSPESLARRHESQNPGIRTILLTGGVIVLMVIACCISSGLLMRWISRSQSKPVATRSSNIGLVLAPDLKPLQRFPAPQLQVNPHDDLIALQAREEKELNTYGWIDQKAGLARIPIERAMELLSLPGAELSATNTRPAKGKSPLELIRERSQAR